MTSTTQKTTPMMLQWHACKKKAGTAILLFRMGDFYEAFYDDAALVAKELGLTLTKRQDVPMSGVPHHTIDSYIDKLVVKGHRVAIAEQTTPKINKELVKREVVRVVTPGTVINSSLLNEKSNNYFACLSQVGTIFALSFIDLTTSEFLVSEFENERELLNEVLRLHPAEILTSKKFYEKHKQLFDEIKISCNICLNTEDDWRFDHQITCDFLIQHFQVKTLDGFGLQSMVCGINSAGALLNYLQEQLQLPIEHIKEIHPYSLKHFMTLDHATVKNLELTRSLNDGSSKNTLLSILDHTETPMGGRLLQTWVKRPLLDASVISNRQDGVQFFLKNYNLLDHLSASLQKVRDIERLMMKITSNYATPRDITSLRFSLEPLQQIKSNLMQVKEAPTIISLATHSIDPLKEVVDYIASALVDEPSARISDGNLFRLGFNKELDELLEIKINGKAWLARYQADLKEETGIKTLKVGYNKMFGYYIEVSIGQKDNVPENFQRRQTLVNAERFITEELKNYEQKVMTAEEKISAIESELFHGIRKQLSSFSNRVRTTSKAIAQIDCLLSLAKAAKLNDYARPVIDTSSNLVIVDGRHPVIEIANAHEKFIPNDTLIDDKDNRLLLITGPNMAGKSTYIRQVALICIMAQVGSFVPAKSARIGIIDKVFTRIGASDDLSRGLSTFMVEMIETANILNNASNRSLVILDEIGRGTSTYDGISIAWSVAEYLLTNEEKKAKTLFATHYFELTKLQEKVPGAVNYNVAVHESDDQVIFLRKIVKGSSDKSYGIHVAKLAGLPFDVIERSKEILEHLEENANRKGIFEPTKKKRRPKTKPPQNDLQLTFFG